MVTESLTVPFVLGEDIQNTDGTFCAIVMMEVYNSVFFTYTSVDLFRSDVLIWPHYTS